MQFDLEEFPTVMYFKKGDVKGAKYDGVLDKDKMNDFVSEGLGRKTEKTEVNFKMLFKNEL